MMFKHNKKGFTLIELIMVIVIIGILASIAIPIFANLVRQARVGATRGALGAVRSTLAIAYAQSAANAAGGGLATYPTELLGTNFADGQVPMNALNNNRNDITVLGAALTDPADFVDPDGSFWYVATGADAGRSGAYVDRATDLGDSPETW